MPTGTEHHRKLAAILSADAVGYSRLMHADEPATVETLNAYRAAMRRVIERHQGRVVNAPGDALLAEFASVVEAVSAAVEIQQALEGRNVELAPERRMQFRIGVNLGDVIEQDDGTIYGDGVNIAARMEALAEGGGVCVSSSVFDAVEGKLALGFDFLGEQQVKNIAKPVRVYRVRSEKRAEQGPAKTVRRRNWLWPAVAGVVLLGAIGLGSWLYRDSIREISEDPALALPKGPAIAVLPFVNLSRDPTEDYFVDGLTEEIITQLTRFRELFVIARNTTFRYKGQAVDVKQIGRELGVRYVLEGSVRKDVDRIRVTAQLIDATSGAHLWAENYDRELTARSVFALQDEITDRVTNTIADAYGILARTALEEVNRKPPDSLTAYDCVLRSYAYLMTYTASAHLAARDCLEATVKLDPAYSDAWAWLSWMYQDEYLNAFNPRPAPLDRALATAQRAVDLDQRSHLAHYVLGITHFLREDRDLFLSEVERALAINPNNAAILGDLGIFMAAAGEWDRGDALIEKTMRLNPYHGGVTYVTLSLDHYRKAQYEEAVATAKQANMPDLWWVHTLLAAALGELGRKDEAQAATADLLKVYPDFPRHARIEIRKMYYSQPVLVARLVESLRKAGLDIPPE